jgi:hypothetical protein
MASTQGAESGCEERLARLRWVQVGSKATDVARAFSAAALNYLANPFPRRRTVSPRLGPATVIWRRLHAARLCGDGLSRAAPVSLLGIAPCGLDHPAAASRPSGLEEASL